MRGFGSKFYDLDALPNDNQQKTAYTLGSQGTVTGRNAVQFVILYNLVYDTSEM